MNAFCLSGLVLKLGAAGVTKLCLDDKKDGALRLAVKKPISTIGSHGRR